MNNCPGHGLGHRSPRLRRARAAAVITATAGMALLAAACGSSPSSTNAGRSPKAASWVAYAQCVRAHGVPNFPDPDSSGQIPKETGQQLGVSDSVLASATQACANLNPANQLLMNPAEERQAMSDGLKISQCLRARGVPKFPDPTLTSDGPRWIISLSRDNFDPHSPEFMAKGRACLHELPAGARLPGTRFIP